MPAGQRATRRFGLVSDGDASCPGADAPVHEPQDLAAFIRALGAALSTDSVDKAVGSCFEYEAEEEQRGGKAGPTAANLRGHTRLSHFLNTQPNLL